MWYHIPRLQKVFDSIPHTNLLLKLHKLGIRGNVWKWFQFYLLGRLPYVKISEILPDILPGISGVPQGSILGPLLFLIYIKVLCDALICWWHQMHQKKIAESDSEDLQKDLNSLHNWSLCNNLYFGMPKCVLLKKTSNTYHLGRFCNCQCIYPSWRRYVTVSSNLSWATHYDQILHKVYNSLGLLRCTFRAFLSMHAKKFYT